MVVMFQVNMMFRLLALLPCKLQYKSLLVVFSIQASLSRNCLITHKMLPLLELRGMDSFLLEADNFQLLFFLDDLRFRCF